MTDFSHWRVTSAWLSSEVKCHAKPYGLQACITKSRVHPDLQNYLKRDTSQSRSRRIMRTRPLIHIYWIAQDSSIFLEWQLLPGWIKTAWDGISFSWPKLNRHVVLWVAMATWKRQTPLLSCLLSVLEFLLSLSVEARWVQDWPVLPWTNSLELKRCCQASTSNGSICDLISIH